MGRLPTTKESKIAMGTYRKDRDVAHPIPFQPVDSIKAPEYMTSYDREFFEYYGKELAGIKLLTNGDLGELEVAAIAYREMRIANDGMMKTGAAHTTKTGYKQKSADWQIFMDAVKTLGSFYNKYGFNVVSRQRIDVPDVDDEDEIDKIKNR